MSSGTVLICRLEELDVSAQHCHHSLATPSILINGGSSCAERLDLPALDLQLVPEVCCAADMALGFEVHLLATPVLLNVRLQHEVSLRLEGIKVVLQAPGLKVLLVYPDIEDVACGDRSTELLLQPRKLLLRSLHAGNVLCLIGSQLLSQRVERLEEALLIRSMIRTTLPQLLGAEFALTLPRAAGACATARRSAAFSAST
mmetsp:Transcript_53768/g.116193  ORF Transcript_53768/g.116193 Transcript_53768/m.116193 type:complete len:201 (-) Transcript_53768:192-794(-)